MNDKIRLKQTFFDKFSSDWKIIKILDFCDFERGTEPGSKSYNREGEGIPFIRVGNIAAQIQEQIYTTSRNIKLCDENDILIALDGSPGVVVRGFKGSYSSGIRKIIIKKPKELLKDFVYFVLQVDFVQKIIEKYATGMTIKHASKSLEHLEIPLPPLSEQQKIVYILDSIQDAIRTQEKIIEKTKELNKSMMADLFKYGGPSFRKGRKLKKTEIGEIPENWGIIKFIDVLDKKTEFRVGELKQESFKKIGKYPIVDQGSENIAGYSDDKEKVYQGKLPVIIFGDHTRIVKFVNFPFIVGGSGVKILIPKEDFDIQFLYYLLSDLEIESRGYNRHFSILKGKLIPLPPLPEQHEIAEILQIIDQKIEIEQKKKALYEELFRTMLNKLMTGEIRVDNLKL